jgi:hypothetical protein
LADDGTETSKTLSGITIPASWDADKQLYYILNNDEYLIDADHFNFSPNGGTYTSYTASATTAVGVIWDYNTSNQYIINYFIWNDKILKILAGGSFGRVQAIATAARCGFDDFFVDPVANKAYQATLTIDTSISMCKIITKVHVPPNARISTGTSPFINQYYLLYDDDDVEIYEGWVKTYKSDSQDYVLVMKSGVEVDFNQRVSESYITKTIDYILLDIETKYCRFLHSGVSTIDTSFTTTFTISFNNWTVLDIIKWAERMAGMIFSIRPDLTMYFGTMIASGKNFVQGTNKWCASPDRSSEPLELSQIII